MSKGLYIHIPFCKYICSYCDFGKKYIKNQPVDEYIDSLIQELDMYAPFSDVDTIYIGGGTPSSLSSIQLTKLFNKLDQLIDFKNIVEFSFEMNPDDINLVLLQLLKANHVTRLSIGAQTLNDEILGNLHRKHTGLEVVSGVKLAQTIFDDISVDFMFNLPNQTREDIEDSLQFIDECDIKHVSYYGLIFEDHTILNTEKYNYWSEDEEGEIYSYIQKTLEGYGFKQYEISNYSKTCHQSKHNIHYWNNDDYYGIGLSSSGKLGDERYTNTYSLKEYINKVNNKIKPKIEIEKLKASDILFEKIMLGLRYYQFIEIDSDVYSSIKDNDQLNDKFDFKHNKIRLKPKFYYISNQIILDILERIEC